MEALFSPFRGPPPHSDGREEPAQPLAIDEPSTVMQTKVPANLAATPENMGMLNTPDNGAIELDVMAHHDQVAPPASHTTQVAGGESIAAGADALQMSVAGTR